MRHGLPAGHPPHPQACAGAAPDLFFAATMPDDIRTLADSILHNPVTVQIGIIAPTDTVSHALYPVPQILKTALVDDLLQQQATGPGADLHPHQAPRAQPGQQAEECGFPDIASLQGNMSQNQRQGALDGFRTGRV